ncbi:hypothetical protein ACFPK5_01100 [Streptomyces beijiangensis]|uniref:hypothetical protein n=1 Tax=Streptomyces beijiangensis TaxID=163361 RepID=UPI003617A825
MRADAITFLSADDHQVRASELGSDDITVLVDEKDAGFNVPLLPWASTSTCCTRSASCAGSSPPTGTPRITSSPAQVVDGAWVWRVFAVSEPEPRPTS